MDIETTLDLFAGAEPTDRLELLIDYGTRLAELEAEYVTLRDSGAYIVHECQAPVFFMVELREGEIHIEADAPEEAAIARGFSGLLKELFNGRMIPLEERLPDDLLQALHLDGLLGMQRQRGLAAIYRRLIDCLSG